MHAYPIVSQIGDRVQRGCPGYGAQDVRWKSARGAALFKSGHSQDIPLHFHFFLIESLLRPNQQVYSRLVSGFLSYPQGLWNEGQWVCYCFSLPLYPHRSSVMSTVNWQRELWLGGGEKKVCVWGGGGNNCYYDTCVSLTRAAIVPVGMDPFEGGKEVNITYPPKQVKMKQQQLTKSFTKYWVWFKMYSYCHSEGVNFIVQWGCSLNVFNILTILPKVPCLNPSCTFHKWAYCVLLTFPKAGCVQLFTLMLPTANEGTKTLCYSKWRRFLRWGFSQRLNGIVFNCVTACCHLLNESGDLLWAGILCFCLQCDHCTNAQP